MNGNAILRLVLLALELFPSIFNDIDGMVKEINSHDPVGAKVEKVATSASNLVTALTTAHVPNGARSDN